MARNLIVCCDGTNNQFGTANTNVVRLVQSLERDPSRQRIYYDPGVGTLPEPGVFTRIGKRVSEAAGLAFGAGMTAKMAGAYAYLMATWEPGDRVFLFGFSRGAYTVRALAALLHLFGLLPAGSNNLLPYLMRQFKASRKVIDNEGAEYWRFSHQFRETFAREVPGQPLRRFPVHFLGAWDTVSSVGWVWDPVAYPFTARNPGVGIVRHAIALDERRAFFRQNRFARKVPGQDLKEVWFAGVHADVGGGYPQAQGALWRVAFDWMLAEARPAGLLIDDARLQRVLKDTPAERAWAEPINTSLKGWWWPAELFPKLRWNAETGRRRPRLNLGGCRTVQPDEVLHETVLRRLADPALQYAPKNLAFLRRPVTEAAAAAGGAPDA